MFKYEDITKVNVVETYDDKRYIANGAQEINKGE